MYWNSENTGKSKICSDWKKDYQQFWRMKIENFLVELGKIFTESEFFFENRGETGGKCIIASEGMEASDSL